MGGTPLDYFTSRSVVLRTLGRVTPRVGAVLSLCVAVVHGCVVVLVANPARSAPVAPLLAVAGVPIAVYGSNCVLAFVSTSGSSGPARQRRAGLGSLAILVPATIALTGFVLIGTVLFVWAWSPIYFTVALLLTALQWGMIASTWRHVQSMGQPS
jgi:hypothetical protein